MWRERRNQVLIGMVVVQLLLVLLVFWPRPAGTQGEPLFPGLKGSDIVALTVTDPGDKSLTLRQVEGAWVLPDADNYPVLSSKITPLLEQIAGLTTANLVAQTVAGATQLKVAADDFEHRLDLEKADGTRIRLYLGTSPRLNAVHVRVEGQDKTYLGLGLASSGIDSRPVSWIDALYLNVSSDEVTGFQVENANGVFAFSKGSDGTWSMADLGPGEVVDQSRVTAVLSQAASLRMLEPLGKEEKAEYGMDQPSAVVTLQTADKTIVLRVGAGSDDGSGYVVISSESPYYVRVSASSVRDLVGKAHNDFLVPPPTATPTATPTPSPSAGIAPSPPPTLELVSGLGGTPTAGVSSTPAVTGTSAVTPTSGARP